MSPTRPATTQLAPTRPPQLHPGDGTLRLRGRAGIDDLDPAVAPAHARQLVRLFARQLLTYRSYPDLDDRRGIMPVGDSAVDVPSTYNAGLGASHRSYIVHLRPGLLWDTMPPRTVTSGDFIRGLKRLASPLARSTAMTYFRSTVRGYAAFADGFAATVPAASATAERLAAYQEGSDISGVFALDDEAMVIELLRPSPDFVHMLALTAASAAPIEYDAFLPGSAELCRNLRSNGPYRVTSYVPGRLLRLEHNPVWRPESDPTRGRRLAAIEVSVDDLGADEQAEELAAGQHDIPWDGPGRRSARASRRDPMPEVLGWNLDPILVLNVAGGAVALRDRRVRAAITSGVDRVAIWNACRARHPGEPVRIATSIVPPGNEGHDARTVDPETLMSRPERARALLRAAEHQHGLSLTVVHERGGWHAQVARLCAESLAEVGFDLRIVALEPHDLDHLAAARHDATGSPWDLMVRAHSPDWHDRNGRVFLQAMFETDAVANAGGYGDQIVDELITRALEAAVDAPGRAAAAWSAVERRILDQHVVVPLLFRPPPLAPAHSSRVRDA